jgi:hypothetical protein
MDVYQKWRSEFHIDDPSKEELHFILCRDIIREYNQSRKEVVLDYDNTVQIDERVQDKTKDIRYKLLKKETLLVKSNQERDNYEAKAIHLESLMKDQSNSHQESMEKAIKMNTNALKDQIESLHQDKIHLNDQLDLKKTLSELTKKNESSFALGVEGENDLVKLLRDDGSFKVEETHGQNHKGDALITLNNKTYCIDSKNHTTYVPLDDVTKLLDDIQLNGYDGGAIIAWGAYIYDPATSGRIKGRAVFKIIAGKPILFVSHANKLPSDAIIDLLKMLEHNIPSDEDKKHGINNDKLRKVVLDHIEKEELDLDSRLNKETRQHAKRKRQLKALKDSLNLLSTVEDDNEDTSVNDSHVDDPVTTIEGLLPLCATKHEDENGQRNSTRDIHKYINNYCIKHGHSLLNEVKCIKTVQLNDILSNLGYELGKKSGKNYENKRRGVKTKTWAVNLSPDLLN